MGSKSRITGVQMNNNTAKELKNKINEIISRCDARGKRKHSEGQGWIGDNNANQKQPGSIPILGNRSFL